MNSWTKNNRSTEGIVAKMSINNDNKSCINKGSTIIFFQLTKICQRSPYNPISANINYNHVFHLLWHCYDTCVVMYQIYTYNQSWMKNENLLPNSMLVITFSQHVVNMIEVDSWKCWIMKQVLTKCGSLKRDNSADTVMCFDDGAWWWIFGQFTAYCLMMHCIKTHLCIFTNIHFQQIAFCQSTILDQNVWARLSR